MKYEQMKTALLIMSKCDGFSITNDDKQFIIAVFGDIIKSLREMEFVTTEISVEYAILKVSTWNNGYFCIVTRQMCSLLYPIVELLQDFFDN